MANNKFIDIFAGRKDFDLSVYTTSELKEAAQDLNSAITRMDGDTSADVPTVEQFYKPKLNLLVAEINRRDYWRNITASDPQPRGDQVRALARHCSFEVFVPKETPIQLGELEAAWQRDCAEILKYIPARATEAFQANEAKLHEIASGGGDVAGHRQRTMEEFYDEYRAKGSAIRKASGRHMIKARELIAPLVDEFYRNLSETAMYRETNERDICVEYGLEFKPSVVLRLFNKTLLALEDRMIPNGNSPKELGAFLG